MSELSPKFPPTDFSAAQGYGLNEQGGQEAQSRDLSYRQPYRTSRAGLRSEKRPQSTQRIKPLSTEIGSGRRSPGVGRGPDSRRTRDETDAHRPTLRPAVVAGPSGARVTLCRTTPARPRAVVAPAAAA